MSTAFDSYRKEVDDQISSFLNSLQISLSAQSPAARTILAPINYILTTGKRWRPTLCMICCEAVGGKQDRLGQLMLIPELIHAGSLIIDDIEDNSSLRRGKPSTHIAFGLDAAINSGNFLYMLPGAVINDSPLADDLKLQIHQQMSTALINLHVGQGTDIAWHSDQHISVNKQDYERMSLQKTGSLARFAAGLGCLVGGATKSQTEAAERFAAHSAIAFQIHDDVLNLQNAVDKTEADDITEGKLSYPVLHTLRHGTERETRELRSILREHTSDASKIRRAIEILEKNNSISAASTQAKKYCDLAVQEIGTITASDKSRQLLTQLAAFSSSR